MERRVERSHILLHLLHLHHPLLHYYSIKTFQCPGNLCGIRLSGNRPLHFAEILLALPKIGYVFGSFFIRPSCGKETTLSRVFMVGTASLSSGSGSLMFLYFSDRSEYFARNSHAFEKVVRSMRFLLYVLDALSISCFSRSNLSRIVRNRMCAVLFPALSIRAATIHATSAARLFLSFKMPELMR